MTLSVDRSARPNVPAFEPEQAAWVRENAWTDQMRRQPVWQPGTSVPTYDKAEALARCECMAGTCGYCKVGQHEFCPAGAGAKREGPRPEAWLSAGLSGVPVWLADRVCRSLCPCSHHTAPASPIAEPTEPPRYESVTLFDITPLPLKSRTS